jgi:multidrug efflux pump subunit AcrA (membrane-fusion protein)
VDFVVKDAYYAELSGKIELLAAEGEMVATGGVLYSINADYSAGQELLGLKLDKAKADKAFAQTNLGDLRAGKTEYDKEMEKASLALQAAQKDRDDIKLLYEAGALPQKDLDDQQVVVDNLHLQYQQQSDRKQKALQELEKSLRDIQYQIEEYEVELNAGTGREITVKATRSGVIREISANLDSGAHINQNENVMKIGVTEENLKAVFALPESVDYLKLGDAITLSIKSRGIYNVSGEITRLIMEDGRLKAEVHFAAEGVTGGETAEIQVHNTSDLFQNLIPLSALRSDAYGDYMLYAERVKSFFGYEYYARKTNVWVVERDNYYAAILIYLNDDKLPVIVNSDKPLSEGDRVRIVGGSDLVEIR